MKLFLKDTVYKSLIYSYPLGVSNMYCLKFDDDTQKKIVKFSNRKNASYEVGISFCEEMDNDYTNCFKKYFIDKIQYDKFENFGQFVNSFHIEISEEDLFYMKLKYPSIFKEGK